MCTRTSERRVGSRRLPRIQTNRLFLLRSSSSTGCLLYRLSAAVSRHNSAQSRSLSMSSNQRWSVQAVAAPASDSAASLLVVFESKKYLIGCGESTTRLFIQQRLSYKKTQNVFLSSLDQDHAGGLSGAIKSIDCWSRLNILLVGTLLGMSEAGTTHVDVFGPPNTDHFIATARYHARR